MDIAVDKELWVKMHKVFPISNQLRYMCWYIEIYGHVSKYLLPTYLAFFSLFQSTEAAVKHKPNSIPFDTCALGQANTDQSEACLGSNMFLIRCCR